MRARNVSISYHELRGACCVRVPLCGHQLLGAREWEGWRHIFGVRLLRVGKGEGSGCVGACCWLAGLFLTSRSESSVGPSLGILSSCRCAAAVQRQIESGDPGTESTARNFRFSGRLGRLGAARASNWAIFAGAGDGFEDGDGLKMVEDGRNLRNVVLGERAGSRMRPRLGPGVGRAWGSNGVGVPRVQSFSVWPVPVAPSFAVVAHPRSSCCSRRVAWHASSLACSAVLDLCVPASAAWCGRPGPAALLAGASGLAPPTCDWHLAGHSVPATNQRQRATSFAPAHRWPCLSCREGVLVGRTMWENGRVFPLHLAREEAITYGE